MQTRLVDQDVWHFGAVVRHVLHAACAFDLLRIGGVGHPKSSLIDPIGFALDLVGKAKGLKHFHGARVDAVGLALDDVGGHALHNHGANFGKLGQLGSQAKAGWASARNEHIYFFGKGFVGSAIATVGRGLLDVRAATPKTIFVKLHCLSPKLPKK